VHERQFAFDVAAAQGIAQIPGDHVSSPSAAAWPAAFPSREAICVTTHDGSALSKAVNRSNVALKLGPILFLDDGGVEMDTNLVENQIRPLTLTRKNALFAGHDEGGRSWSRLASLIATCKLNSVDPYAWMKATLEAIANGHPQSRIDELMPWAFKSSSPTQAA
jgi:hypothetical protein